MKIKYLLPLSMWTLFNLVASIQGLKAQNTPAGEILSGSTQKSEDIASKVDAVFVGQVTQIGFAVPEGDATASYPGIRVKILQVLRGSISAQVVKVTLRTTWRQDVHETPPTVGSSYIFFVKNKAQGASDHFTALKLLPATDDNTANVKALIAAAPALK
jgi:hypothetical protein